MRSRNTINQIAHDAVNGSIYCVLSLQAAKTANLNAPQQFKAMNVEVDAVVADLKRYRAKRR
jgi:hypothetical protein